MHPKSATNSQLLASTSSKLPDEHEIDVDLRRSIDSALKGLETIHQSSSSPTSFQPSPETNDDKTSSSSTNVKKEIIDKIQEQINEIQQSINK